MSTDAPTTDTGLDCSTVGCAPPPGPGEECTAPCGCCTGPTDGGTPDAPMGDAGGDVACGTMTCGPGQYCFIMCTCCGIDSGADGGDGGSGPTADYSCLPIPTGCDASDLCTSSCDLGLGCGGSCTDPRVVQCPCA